MFIYLSLFVSYLFSTKYQLLQNNNKNNNLGDDERHIINNTYDAEDVVKISKYIDILEKKNTLQQIKLSYIQIELPEPVKIILHDYFDYMDIAPYRVKNGGLLEDW